MGYENAAGTKLLATNCAVCARPLLDAVSGELGIGPDCRKKHGFNDPCDEAARAEANALVHAIAVAQTGPAVLEQVARLRTLGFAKLADRIAERLGQDAIKVTLDAYGSLVVLAGYVAEATPAWRAIPGRRWNGEANVVPHAQAPAVRALLAKFYPAARVDWEAPEAPPQVAGPVRRPPPYKAVAGSGRPNRYGGPCVCCGANVAAEAGTVFPSPAGWRTCCADPACRALCGLEPVPAATPPAPVVDLVTPAVARAKERGLFAHQIEGVAWLAGRTRALLADDMGLGKTAQVLTALAPQARAVVVCPSSVRLVWRDEAARWAPALKVRVLDNVDGEIPAPAPGEMVVMSYERAAKLGATLERFAEGATLVCDEAHALKNYKTKRHVGFLALAKHARAVWLLTGTPLMGRPFDLWGVLGAGLMGRDAYGSFDKFVAAFNGQRADYGWAWGKPTPAAVEGLRRVALRRMKDECLDLPPTIERVVPVNGLSPAVRAELDALAKELDLDMKDWSSPAFRKLAAVRAKLSKARLPAVLEMVEEHEEAGRPLVVFSAFRAIVDTLGEREGWVVVTGSETPAARAQAVADFQAGKCKGIALTIAAGGVGLTLTRAADVLMADLDWTPAMNAQAVDRVRRIGQTGEKIVVTYLVTEHALEKRLHAVLRAKERLIDATVAKLSKAGDVANMLERA